jgi:hypothetical protein
MAHAAVLPMPVSGTPLIERDSLSQRSLSGWRMCRFWLDLTPIPNQGDRFDQVWNGERVDKARNCRIGAIFLTR